ncbi:MAG: hypothetical protein NTW87_15560 [Planctomycetota bacterium]|nr:hypothetical protein [Planctomycetota bacterium]
MPDNATPIENPKSEIRNPKSEIPNPKSEIPNPKLEIPDPKSEIANRKSQIASPEPVNPWQLAEEGWEDLLRAAATIQAAADAIKKTERSVEGYNIERSLNKHKPDLMPRHLENLRDHRKANKL